MIEATPVAITNSTNRGFTSAASAVLVSSTTPAISQTVRSMYQWVVGTM